MVPLENHQLTLSLGDVCGEGLQDVAERHLHLGLQLSTRSQAGGQLYFIKLPTVTEEMTERSTGKTYLMDHIRFSGHAFLVLLEFTLEFLRGTLKSVFFPL